MANAISRNISRILQKAISHFYKRDKNLWVFGEWFGNRVSDNSLYFANYVVENHKEIKVVWIAQKQTDTSLLASGVTVLETDSPQALEALKHAGVVVLNQGREDVSIEHQFLFDGALVVNLWHGVPWKKIGKDGEKNTGWLRALYNTCYSKLFRVDMTVAMTQDFADIISRMFCIDKSHVLLTGYPRNSIFYSDNHTSVARDKAMDALQAKTGRTPTKIITYMPTFRDNTDDLFSFETLKDDTRLNEVLSKHNAVVVQRAHFVSQQRGQKESVNSRITAIESLSSQELLAATDLLITDYSSCFFDFLVTGRPIIHYLYDYDYYANKDRGLYYTKEEVACGDVPQDIDSLVKAIEENLSCPDKCKELRGERKAIYMTYESKNSCCEIFEAIRQKQ